MNFHYGKVTALCGRTIEPRYMSDDWTIVDCKRCWKKKDLNNLPKTVYKHKAKYD